MGMLRPVGYPANRSAGRWVFDALVTLLAAASAVGSSVHDTPHPQRAAVVVLALAAAPLLVRRIWPIPVFAVVLALNAGARPWGHVHAVNGLALLIALYTVAAMRPRRDALVCAGLLELTVVAGLLLFAGGGWWYDAIFASRMVAAAPAAPTSPNCTTALSGWNASGTSRAHSPRRLNAPGSPARCTTSSPTISPS